MTSTNRPGSASSQEWLPSTTVPAVPTAVHIASKDSLGMMPSRLAQITVTGKRRRFSSSSSGRRSARRAMLATFTTELGLRTRLGSASSKMTGSTRVAWRMGQTSEGKWRPQSHSGRSAIDVSTLPRFQDEPPMEFTSTRERTTSGWS